MMHEIFVIITGMSGAGKSLALRNLEDLGFFCIDNIPPSLVPKFAEICRKSQLKKIAIGIDIRAGKFLDSIFDALGKLEQLKVEYSMLFLDASDETLIRRYSETRRRHPFRKKGKTIRELIKQERSILLKIRQRANRLIETSNMSPREFRDVLLSIYRDRKKSQAIEITIISFGFKHGLPIEADLVLDTRFLPNPFYVESLKHYKGNDIPVQRFVLKHPAAQKFLNKIHTLLKFLIPHYVKEGKSYLTIGIGCTGGHHRSVVISNKLRELMEKSRYKINLQHRDIHR